MSKKTLLNENEIIKDYISGMGCESVALKHHAGKKRIKEILFAAGIPLKKIGAQEKSKKPLKIEDWRIEKFKEKDGYHYEAISMDKKIKTSDYMNSSGILTSYIKKTYGKKSSLYERRKYYMETGNYWWEQWFKIILVKDEPSKKCPFCDWSTKDLENKSGVFTSHLLKSHGLSVERYLESHPEDVSLFKTESLKIERRKLLEDRRKFVVCPICGEKFRTITEQHLKNKHQMLMKEFKEKFPETDVMSDDMYEEVRTAASIGKLTVSKHRFISKYEREIQEFLTENDIDFECNRQILIGKEIDILVPSKKIGIEFDGLKFHTEWFGKKKHGYHLDKTEKCNENGYGLIHIFEDEYVNHKDIVYSKLSHILNIDIKKEKIGGRKCIIKYILKKDAEDFLNKYHIQGFSSSTLYIGAFYKDNLIAVMTFKNGNLKNPFWELTRFATNSSYICQGVASKMLSFFIKDNNPLKIISFADRRWTIDKNNNLYTVLGFRLDKILPPDYRYYNERVDKYKRVHKMSFNKKKLSKKYGFDEKMTETEMAKALGYDRIWDCGLIRYVWENPAK